MADYTLQCADGYLLGRFQAMASPCELLLETEDRPLADWIVQTVQRETIRIEHKFSRYRSDNIIHRINTAQGQPVQVDHECARLLDYADQCYQLSDGLFDITSGVLRRVWRFNGSSDIPSQSQIDTVLNHVGWHRASWKAPVLTLKQGMEIDLGGIGKEYAVDRAAQLVCAHTDVSALINFGGDLYVTGPRRDNLPWYVGIDDPTASGQQAVGQIAISRGGLATSGDARRYLIHNGQRYSHILNPKTGWPVANAPRSVTVIAGTCTEAGMLSTFALLQGAQAKDFLKEQGVQFWCVEN